MLKIGGRREYKLPSSSIRETKEIVKVNILDWLRTGVLIKGLEFNRQALKE